MNEMHSKMLRILILIKRVETILALLQKLTFMVFLIATPGRFSQSAQRKTNNAPGLVILAITDIMSGSIV